MSRKVMVLAGGSSQQVQAEEAGDEGRDPENATLKVGGEPETEIVFFPGSLVEVDDSGTLARALGAKEMGD